MSDDIHALIGAYAVDAVTDQERAGFEQHLAACPHCRAELTGLQAAAGELATTAQTTPPPALRAEVLAQIRSVRPLPPAVDPPDDLPGHNLPGHGRPAAPGPTGPASLDRARHRRQGHPVRRWAAAAVAAAAIVAAGLAWHPWTSPPAPVSAVQQVLHAPDAHRTVQHAGSTTATLVRSTHLDKAVLVANDMAPPPAGHTYQLWYLTASGHAVTAGLATPSDTGNLKVALTGNADTATAAAITIEPAGGSPQPTTKPIMVFTFTT